MQHGTPCRHCRSPARTRPCWNKPRKGMCKGAHDQWMEDLTRESADLGLPRAVGLDEMMARRQAKGQKP